MTRDAHSYPHIRVCRPDVGPVAAVQEAAHGNDTLTDEQVVKSYVDQGPDYKTVINSFTKSITPTVRLSHMLVPVPLFFIALR